MSGQIISMSLKELDRYELIQKTINKEINGVRAAKLLKLSYRQFKRLKKNVKDKGPEGLIHGNRGKVSNRRMPEKEREQIKKHLHARYSDFKPKFASEKLAEHHNIVRDPKTIRSIMIKEGLWKVRKAGKRKEHRSWRQRKAQKGEMTQFDGSYHDWFEGRGPECCLLGGIDDATGDIFLKFAEHEGVFPVFDYWRDYVIEKGKPRAIYLDKFSTYRMNQRVAKENHETLTQFQRAMKQLDIEAITAHSPEAKGRVERLFETLQDRLVKEMRLACINDIESANKFLKDEFLPRFNKQFSVPAAQQGNLHRKLTSKERAHIDSIFSRQTERTVQNDFTISFNNQWYQLIKQQPVTICKKDQVTIEERLDGSLKIRLRGKYLNYEELPARPQRSKNQPWVLAKTGATTRSQKPGPNHPWRASIHAKSLIKETVKKGHF